VPVEQAQQDWIGPRRSTVSKRHQNSRRKSYGRRQHELRERTERRNEPDDSPLAWGEGNQAMGMDRFAFVDGRGSGLRFALGD